MAITGASFKGEPTSTKTPYTLDISQEMLLYAINQLRQREGLKPIPATSLVWVTGADLKLIEIEPINIKWEE